MDTQDFSLPGSNQSQLLSIIIPAYNAAATLGDQLEALKAQVYKGQWEIVVVNNNSVDNTVKIVQSYQQEMPHLRLVDALAMRRRAYAYNVGAKAAQGDAFIFCDADDIVAPGWLAAMDRALEMYDVVVGGLEVETLNRNAPPRPAPNTGADYKMMQFLPFGMTCNFAVSREAFEAVGGFVDDLTSGGDVDLSWRLQLHGYKIYDVPEAIVHYRYRQTFWALWKQFARFGYYQPLLYRRFKLYGMPRSPVRRVFRQYKRLLKKAVRILISGEEPDEKAKWVCHSATHLGRMCGSLRYRTLYL